MIRFALALLAIPVFAFEPSRVRNPSQEPSQVTAHEWGTFTSVARADGSSARWAPLSGPSDLPCFVESLGSPQFKQLSSGLVRMETPVVYFYSAQPTTLSVRVGFPQGWITEWYPRATSTIPIALRSEPPLSHAGGEIRWDRVEVLPDQVPVLPVSKGASHYFAARATDAAPIRIGNQWEKLIFYRGVGDFAVPLRPIITSEGRVRVTNAGSEPVPVAILFENRGEKIGYRIIRSLNEATEISLPELTSDLNALRGQLANELVEFGLYRKEALAMIETWHDSWFEEGMRLFYIVPKATVDRLLPLEIKPAPASIARVFVGRIEMLSPAIRETIETAAKTGDSERLAKFGRFLGPWITQMENERTGILRTEAVRRNFQKPSAPASCVQ
ncbi:MAG TPA: hypothetical protein VEX68_07275 [Bryobacteraceae bacterium]|nr:hypothetical protein [Bryobacteraceae bacterium]